MILKLAKIFILGLFILLSGCFLSKKITIKGNSDIILTETNFSHIKNWAIDDHRIALQAFLNSCRKFAKLPQNKPLNGKILDISPADYRDVCDIADVVKTMSNNQIRNFFENWFKLFKIKDSKGNSNGLFTGYYESTLYGSFVKTEKYKYPIYTKPNDKNLEQNLTREDVNNGALENKNLEIIYVNDDVELFFMHIQGSGKVKLENGQEVKISYNGKNKFPFYAIANYLLEKKYINKSQLNPKLIKLWLKNNPELSQKIMNLNSSFTYFKINNSEYTYGAQLVPLTKERSVAVDDEIIPYGSLLWIETKIFNNQKNEDYHKLYVAQDTGSAITGAVRGDLFFGYGDEAEIKASAMNSKGEYYILLPINFIDRILGR
jgi:membrane-bound lytic murein transglycosylase A